MNSLSKLFGKIVRQILILIQSNLVIRNLLVTLKLFLNAKFSLSLWSKLTIGHGKWFLNTNLFLITKFDCNSLTHNPCLSLMFTTKYYYTTLAVRIWMSTKTKQCKEWCRPISHCCYLVQFENRQSLIVSDSCH